MNIQEYPEILAQINQDEKSLRTASYQIDIQDTEAIAHARNIILRMENLLLINGSAAPEHIKDGNILGYGLAACQLKSEHTENKRAPRAGVVMIPPPNTQTQPVWLRMLNAQILDQGGLFKYRGEGCLSFPGKYLTTNRFRYVKVGFVDADTLKPREIEFHGFEAVVLQHEVDHQDGKLFVDRHQAPITAEKKPGPNDPCPCGKLKADGTPMKYKKCCG